MSGAYLLLIALALPLAGAAGIVAARLRPNLREATTLWCACALFGCVALLVPLVLAGGRPDRG